MDGMFNEIARPMVLLALLISSSGCGDDGPSAPDPQGTDGLTQFNYLGSGFDGQFLATGKFERDGVGAIKQNSFATAVDVTQPKYDLAYYGIVAVHFTPPEFDGISILLSNQTIGEYPISPFDECSATVGLGMAPCASVDFDFHIPLNGSDPVDASSFELVDGTVTVTKVSNGRLIGIFNGTARQLGDWFSGERHVPEIEVAITNGTFDVPIITYDDWVGTPQRDSKPSTPLSLLEMR
jgi:hypothetical protein